MGNLLRRAWSRLWSSGLLLAAGIWCLFGLLSYSLPSGTMVNPWQQRIYDFSHLDIGTLRLLLVTASQQASFPILVVLFLGRLCLNPIIDAFVYYRLGRGSQLPWKSFGSLYIMLYLGLLLLGWLLLLSASSLLQLIMAHPFLCLLGALCSIFGFALWFALYKARLALEARSWPSPLAWLQVALARLLLTGMAGIIFLWLHRWAIGLSGLRLIAVLFLAELMLAWARLWQTSCAMEAVASRARWGSFGGAM